MHSTIMVHPTTDKILPDRVYGGTNPAIHCTGAQTSLMLIFDSLDELKDWTANLLVLTDNLIEEEAREEEAAWNARNHG